MSDPRTTTPAPTQRRRHPVIHGIAGAVLVALAWTAVVQACSERDSVPHPPTLAR